MLIAAMFAAGESLVPAVGHAQGAVRGQLALLERGSGEHGSLENAVVYLEPVARVASGTAATGVPPSATIAMRGREFIPHVRVVRAGGEVAFPNDDPFSHNVFSNTALGSFDLGLYRYHATRSAHFDRPGVYPIYCNIHHRMVSFVIAVPAPWAAQPTADGQFEITDVPAGSYVLHAWHERAGEMTQSLVVPAAGVGDVRLTLDARAYMPALHLNKFGLPYAATRADRY